jgi:hypothetical protein
MELHTKKVINELMLILEKIKNKYHQIGLRLTEKNVIQNLIAD